MKIKGLFIALFAFFLLFFVTFLLWKEFQENRTGGGIPVDTRYRDIAKNEVINNFFSSESKKVSTTKDIVWADFDKNQDERKILLSEALEKNLPFSKEGADFLKYVSEDTFDVFVCREKEKEFRGIYFLLKHIENYQGDLYADMKNSLSLWEPNIPRDIGALLFFDGDAMRDSLGQKIVFGEEIVSEELGLRYRKALFGFGSEKREIYSGLVGGNLVFSTSKHCLFLAAADLFDLVP